MAYDIMSSVKTGSDEVGQNIYEYSVTAVGTSGVSDIIILPAGIVSCGVTVAVGASAICKVQACTDLLYTINSDPNSITWVDWSKGNITANAQDTLNVGASAIRLFQVSGSNASTLKVSAK